MSATIIQFPGKMKRDAKVRHRSPADVTPRQNLSDEDRDDLDERLHRFLLKSGIIQEEQR